MKKVLFALLALFSINAYADADWLSPDGMTKVMEGVDDGTFHVSLGHTFPYYGGIFTDAWMSSNGVIILYDPTTQFGNWNTGNSMCCSGMELSNWQSYQGDQFSFMLAPLWTDLVDRNLTPDDGYYYRTDEGGSSFLWYNVNEFYNDNKNTFQVDLWPDGSFDFLYDEVDITQHSVFIGSTGDITQNEVNQLGYYQNGVTEFDIDFYSQTVNGGRAWYGQDGGYESTLDCSNALNDPQCPGYEEAYYDQQCSSDPLYDSGCQGYEQAYYDQQCSYDDLYDQGCPGYQGALAAQDAAGTDFIFGDDISDFYDTEEIDMPFEYEEEIDYGYEEEMDYGYEEEIDYGYEEEEEFYGYTEEPGPEGPGIFGYDETENYDDGGGALHSGDGHEEVYTESVVYEDEPGVSEESIVDGEIEIQSDLLGGDSESIALEDEYIEEDFTHMEEDMSNIEENLLITEETISGPITRPTIDAVSIALTTVNNAESAAVQTVSQQSAESVISVTEEQKTESVISVTEEQETAVNVTESTQNEMAVFSSMDNAFADATFEMMVDPTITISEIIVAVESPVEQATTQQEEEQTVEFQMEATTPQMDTGFAAQQDQSFSTGQSITAVLNNVQPNFSQFDVAPPSQTEQQTTAKAESQANNMSEEQLAANLDEFANDMKDSGGFGDQSLTVFLMGRNAAFAQYNNVNLQDNPFYDDKGLPISRVQNDRNTMLQLIGTSGKHEELISGQYK